MEESQRHRSGNIYQTAINSDDLILMKFLLAAAWLSSKFSKRLFIP